ncbi:hypothetical protein [Novosphingobium sp.]|uniref:hypothetical protein n=1 Tax=Novosphingobium sp. TaxID=1874826 RepID=UPI0025EF1004|nr:hypothetical protein [Novosphingobium sp.]
MGDELAAVCRGPADGAAECAGRVRRAVERLYLSGHFHEWGVLREALGTCCLPNWLERALPSVNPGGLVDKQGRKPTMLACLAIMAAGMYFAHTRPADRTVGLAVHHRHRHRRMLTSTNAADCGMHARERVAWSMAIYVIGYPLGGVIGDRRATGCCPL